METQYHYNNSNLAKNTILNIFKTQMYSKMFAKSKCYATTQNIILSI